VRFALVVASISLLAVAGAGIPAPATAAPAAGVVNHERLRLIGNSSDTGSFNVYARFRDVNHHRGLVAMILVLPRRHGAPRMHAQITEVASDSLTTTADSLCDRAKFDCSTFVSAHQALVGVAGRLPARARLIVILQGEGHIHLAKQRGVRVLGPDRDFDWRLVQQPGGSEAAGTAVEFNSTYTGRGSIAVATIPCMPGRLKEGKATLSSPSGVVRVADCPDRPTVIAQADVSTSWTLKATDLGVDGQVTRLVTTSL
jgi:hypothetical protein